MIYPLRALLSWEKATKDRVADIVDCIHASPKPEDMSNPIVKWTSRQLTFWRNAEQPAFMELTIEYQPNELIADAYSLNTYVWCWRNIRIAPEELIKVIREQFCNIINPVSYKITMRESGSMMAHDVCLISKSDHWRD